MTAWGVQTVFLISQLGIERVDGGVIDRVLATEPYRSRSA
jgi:hypothetical protein